MPSYPRIWALAAPAVLAACNYTPHESGNDFDIVAEINTPTGVKTGRSTVSYTRIDYEGPDWCSWTCSKGTEIKVNAEAVSVDITDRDTLYILLTSSENSDWIANNSYAFSRISLDISCETYFDKKSKYKKDIDGDGCADVPVFVEMPYFVKFENINDFNSIEEVDPFKLSETFGKGVKLKSLRLEPATNVQPQIRRRLPWLVSLPFGPPYHPFYSEKPKFPLGVGLQSFVEGH